MRWPGKVPHGLVCDETASIADIFPTFAHLIGGEMPTDRVIDGRNIWELMTVRDAKTPHEAYFYYLGDYHTFQTGDDISAWLTGVRSGPWKLHVEINPYKQKWDDAKDNWSLYNLEEDPGESTDVSQAHPEIRQRLMALLEEARKDLGDRGSRGAGARGLGKVSEAEGERIGRLYRGM